MKKKILSFIAISAFVLTITSCEKKDQSPNVLFISVDDLRPELGCYGNKILKTPVLDKLADDGALFTNHFVQVPTCGPSRQSLLTGLRPINRAQLSNDVTAKELANKPEGALPETFIHQLRRNGYYTVGIGKISHSADGLVYGYTEKPSNKRELPHSWDEFAFDSGKWGTGWNAFFGYANGENRQSMEKQVKPYEAGNVGDDGYPDGLTAQLAIKKLRELKGNPKPFFLGVGFFKPHLPFNAPAKYWDFYERDSIPLSPNPLIPENVNRRSLHNSGELNNYRLTDELANLNRPVSDAYARKLKHAYYASISYIDHQIGKVLLELRSLGLDQNTIVVVWGDHGWHLGDQQMWGKHALFDKALNSALIIKLPKEQTKGDVIKSIVETIDIYPTILELCNVDLPYSIDGESFTNLLYDPKTQKKGTAYSYFKNGISLRTDRYRLTRYYRKEEPKVELYDHVNDPLETVNIASNKTELVSELMPLLEKGNTGLYESK